MAKPKSPSAISWAQATRDFAIRFATSNKYVPTLTAIVLICAIERMPREKIPETIKILFASDVAAIVGWSVAGVLLLSSIAVIVFGRKTYLAEIARVCAERDALQTKLLDRTVQRSNLSEE